jgi:ubiquinone/menaquinone biosynthesis C-methylase UbiE
VEELNYDQSDIHLSYDKARSLPDKTVRLWLETIARYVPRESTKTIIDIGCGTGRFTEVLSNHFSARVLGIDPSLNMLVTARQITSSPLVEFIRGAAESIPLVESEVDLVFLSMVYHHIQDKDKAAAEFNRILKRGGFLCIRTSTLEALNSYPWLQFFPGAREIEVSRIPSRDSLITTLESRGFQISGHSVVQQLFAENPDEYLEKIKLRGLSTLRAISDDEFQEGLVRFEKYCREREAGDVVLEDIDLFVFHST